MVLAFFLPAQLSQWDDRALLDTPNIVREEERELFADSIRLTVPEKLLLLRSGDLSWLDLEDAGAGQVRVALVEGEAQISVSMEAELENAAADVQAEAEKNAQKWSARLSAAQSELRVLQRLGAPCPLSWSDTDVVELTSQREVIYIDQESQVSFTLYYMELSCAPYTVSLAVDAETGRILILTLRWTRGSAPSWGINGAMNFGTAWRDYWGLDGVDASWRSQYIQSILENTEGSDAQQRRFRLRGGGELHLRRADPAGAPGLLGQRQQPDLLHSVEHIDQPEEEQEAFSYEQTLSRQTAGHLYPAAADPYCSDCGAGGGVLFSPPSHAGWGADAR